MMPNFNEFIEALVANNIEEKYGSEFSELVDDSLLPWLEASGNFILVDEKSSETWHTYQDSEDEDTVEICLSDYVGSTTINCFAYIVSVNFDTEKPINGVYVLEKAYTQQGEGFDCDIDGVYAKYRKRNDLTIKKHLEICYDNLIKQYIKEE